MSNSTSFLKVLLLCALILYGIIPLSAQIYASSNIQTQSIANTTLSLKQVLDQLETKYRITISYKSDIVTNRNVLWNDYASSSIDGDLKAILDPFNLIYKKIGNTAYVIIDTNIGTYKNDDAIDANNTPTAGDALLSLDFNNVQLSKLIEVIEAQTDYKFSFDQSVIDANTLVSIKEQNATLDLILSKISEQMDIKFMRQSLEIFIQEKADIKNNWVEANNIYRDLSKEISGRIIDNSGEALPGVNIIVKGTSIGTTTDINGYYKLDVPDDATLVVTFIGYITQTIQVGAKNIIDIILRPDTKELDEVVVVGYGEQRKSDLTGAVASLGEKNFNKGANVAVEQLLAGRVAGVQMTQSNGEPGGGFAMRIRGSSSITASNDPLYVIDGFPIDNSPLLSSSPGGGAAPNNSPRNPLNALNPADIESIEILKDASATAIYGSRGANGVVLITTKKGGKGATEVDYNFYVGTQSVSRKLDVMNRDEYIKAINEISTAQTGSPEFPQSEIDEIISSGVDTDWQNELFRAAPVQNHAITIKGGQNKTQYYASLNYFNQQGVIMSSGLERYIFRINLNQQIGNKVKIGFSVNNSLVNDDFVSYGQGTVTSAGVINSAIDFEPTQPIYDEDGNYTGSRSNFQMDNPVAIANTVDLVAKTNRFLGNSFLEYSIIDGLNAKLYFGADLQNQRRDSYIPSTLRRTLGISTASISTLERSSYITEFTLNYNKKIYDKHLISAVGGYTYQEFISRSFGGSIRNFFSDITQTNNLSLGDQATAVVTSNTEDNSLLSYLGRVNYNFDDRLLLTLSYRADGSSRFGQNSKWGYFPSVAVGWRLENEGFISSLNLFDQLKIRASWGLTGNQDIENYGSLGTLSGGFAVIDNNLTSTAQPARLANPNLKWEATEQTNIGIDVGFLEGRIRTSIDFFRKKTEDLLLDLPIPISTGFTSILSNVGSVENKGWEFSLNTRNLVGKFGWTSDFNFTHIQNKVLSLGNDIEQIVTGQVAFTSQFAILRPGEPLYSYFGHQVVGIFQNADQVNNTPVPATGGIPGNPIYSDINNDGIINADDRTILGSPIPKFTWGFNNTFTYQNFQLDVFINAQHGSKVLNNNLMLSLYPANLPINRLSEPILNRWTADNPSNKWPSSVNPSTYGVPEGNSLIILDNSFVRINNVQLSYRIPNPKINWLRAATVYVAGQNLYTFSDYIGYDPEVNSYGGNGVVVDYNAYPRARTIILGFNLGF